MSTHELKCWGEQYEAIRTRAKAFEVRYNDRDFKVGDRLRLREFDPSSPADFAFTGSELMARITYIYDSGRNSPTHGALADGWVVIGIEVVTVTTRPGHIE